MAPGPGRRCEQSRGGRDPPPGGNRCQCSTGAGWLLLHLLDLKFATQLLEAGLDPSHDDGKWLHVSATQGLAKMVKLLIEFHVDVNVEDHNDRTVLMNAADNEKTPVVQMLLDAGTDPNLATTDFDSTATQYAARKGRGEIVRALLQAGQG